MLRTLLDREGGAALPLPPPLAERYGGPLRFPEGGTHVFANFVSTIDGIVSFAVPGHDRARDVSRGYAGDRFVLALLRAVADAVIVGAGTLRKEPDSIWTAEAVFPDARADFAALRTALGVAAHPLTIIVTASGAIDLGLPVFGDGGAVLIATTAAGAKRLAAVPSHVSVRVVAQRAPLRATDLVRIATEMTGGRRILTEGGPTLFGRFLEEHAVDELFLTIAPQVAGRSREAQRNSLVDGVMFLPANAPRGRLVTLKTGDDYLFTRFAFGPGRTTTSDGS
jgi:riboflavin biosynthesis pyrimidine reductase